MMERSVLDFVYTIAEAATLWGKGIDTVRDACNRPVARFREGECRKSGGTWIVTRGGMERLYGIVLGMTDLCPVDFSIQDVYTVNEAAMVWGKSGSVVKDGCDGHGGRDRVRFLKGECRQSGRTWLVTREGMVRVFGEVLVV